MDLILHTDAQHIVSYRSPSFRLEAASHQVVTNDKLQSFGELPRGWHYGDGVPPSRRLIAGMTDINDRIYEFGFSRTDVFPQVNGGITLTIYEGAHLIDLMVEPNGRLCTFSHELNEIETQYQENITLDEAWRLIEGVGELCGLSGSSINSTMQRLKVDSKALLLKHLATAGYRFFYQSAPANIPEAFASIFKDTTEPWLAIQQSIGSLPKTYYLAGPATKQK